MKKIIYIIMCASLMACGQKQAEEPTEAEAEGGVTDVTLTDAQVSQLKVTTGKMPMHSFPGLIEANGSLAVEPQSEAEVSPYIGANVRTILVREGQMVSKGQPLATLSHPDLIELQSRYLSAYNRLSYVSQEYERQKKLYKEKVGAGKDYQQILSEYRTLQGELRMTASQLQLIGISTAALRQGKTVNTISVKSPISGMVDAIMVKTGQYADSQTPMFRIVNTDNLYADLLVFEKDIPKVHKGQHVSLSLKSATGAQYSGVVYSVGNTFESNPKAVHVRVNISGKHEGLITGMYLCGKIQSENTSVTALPSEGVVDDSGKSYVFTASHSAGKWTYHPVEVTRGREEGGYIEVRLPSAASLSSLYALDNAYYIMSEMKKSETGEED